jgi:hypothetical protein
MGSQRIFETLSTLIKKHQRELVLFQLNKKYVWNSKAAVYN